jgi:hypothetical protein
MNRRHERRGEAAGEVVACHRDEPVVAVDDVEVVAVPQLDAGREHVGVHALDPGDELAEVGRAAGLQDPVDRHPGDDVLGGRFLAAAREDVDFGAQLHEPLRELAHMAREAALDQRRVLPGQDQN